jgi:hypothetical protein
VLDAGCTRCHRTTLRECPHGEQTAQVVVDRLSRLVPEHRLEGVDPVDRLGRLHPVDRLSGLRAVGGFSRFDLVCGLCCLGGLGILRQFRAERGLDSVGAVPLVDPGLQVEAPCRARPPPATGLNAAHLRTPGTAAPWPSAAPVVARPVAGARSLNRPRRPGSACPELVHRVDLGVVARLRCHTARPLRLLNEPLRTWRRRPPVGCGRPRRRRAACAAPPHT